MKLGKLVAKGVAEDVLDVAAEEQDTTTEADTALPTTAQPVTAGSSAQR
ncbi:hypothetical protein [Streptacidiphilus jiangxiensis]|uniref:Uncharacterized protein n=1 Tax=Streptacidiphilus jiangxiensis TaxID=235985 RepID=A0A1H7S390_STRJI|nr:hypothetical protein [Streptacidiphilus jiangxiensis]SEL66264.1 hypothetical protein SAMN05414137_11194 [Streptacidiphilus jiangxiensis]